MEHSDEEFGTLRSLLQQEPDVTVFADVCAAIERMEEELSLIHI